MACTRYEDKVALITGGGGMGRATALRILEESGKVVLTDFSQAALSKLKKEFEALGYAQRVL